MQLRGLIIIKPSHPSNATSQIFSISTSKGVPIDKVGVGVGVGCAAAPWGQQVLARAEVLDRSQHVVNAAMSGVRVCLQKALKVRCKLCIALVKHPMENCSSLGKTLIFKYMLYLRILQRVFDREHIIDC